MLKLSDFFIFHYFVALNILGGGGEFQGFIIMRKFGTIAHLLQHLKLEQHIKISKKTMSFLYTLTLYQSFAQAIHMAPISYNQSELDLFVMQYKAKLIAQIKNTNTKQIQ